MQKLSNISQEQIYDKFWPILLNYKNLIPYNCLQLLFFSISIIP